MNSETTVTIDVSKPLDIQTARRWLIRHCNLVVSYASIKELDHLAYCLCLLLTRFQSGNVTGVEEVVVDEFISALASENLVNAFVMADETNSKYMRVYAQFIYDVIPINWRKGRPKFDS